LSPRAAAIAAGSSAFHLAGGQFEKPMVFHTVTMASGGRPRSSSTS
jgi:hypothetical protein